MYAHTHTHTHTHTHISKLQYIIWSWHKVCCTTTLHPQTEYDRRQTYSYLCSMFWRALVHLFARPLGSSISQNPWLSPLNSGDYRDWHWGFDLHTTPLNHKKEAGIFSKGCLCAPIPHEDWAKSSMKVSELQSKTVFPRVQKQILHQSLCCFAKQHW